MSTHPASRLIGRLALRSLHAELVLYPKPGLVSTRDAGAHTDMDASTFVQSLFALRGYFAKIAALGASSAPFGDLRDLGKDAEARMLRATRGRNTHRGAIFALGLVAAAAGVMVGQGEAPTEGRLREVLTTRWIADLPRHFVDPCSHGQQMAARHGAPGARGEAMLGFPSVFDVALPALREALARGAPARRAQLHAFFSLLATVKDTNVLWRGGPDQLAVLQQRARAFLARGSVFATEFRAHAVSLHRWCTHRRLSPGGTADLFAATWFVHLLGSSSFERHAS
jgi:triphosphoribosyl-dephospho-CoA synthase